MGLGYETKCVPLTAHRVTSLFEDIHQSEDVLEVNTGHSSPEVNGKGCGTSKIWRQNWTLSEQFFVICGQTS